MVKALILLLTGVQLSVVKGLGSDSVLEIKNETVETNNSIKRILNGSPASPRNYPFMVRLWLIAASANCGGSIIADHWIMTASHCTQLVPCNGIQIFPWVWPISESVYAAECFHHEQYRTGTFEYDISLLRVDLNILADGRAKAVRLPPPGTRYSAGTPAIIVGWGQTETGVYPYSLLQGNVIIENWDACNARLKQNVSMCNRNANCPIGDIPIRVLCTEGLGSTPPSGCFGDSGGPLIVESQAVGVFSFLLESEDGSCLPGTPSMFTSVVDYLPWIFNHVNPSVDTSQFPILPEHILA